MKIWSYVIVKSHHEEDIFAITRGRGRGVNNKDILRVQEGFNWLLSQHGFIPLVYNSADQNVLINDWYRCLQVLSKLLSQCMGSSKEKTGAITNYSPGNN